MLEKNQVVYSQLIFVKLCRNGIYSHIFPQMIEIHKKLRNMSATDADIKFLSLASTLSMYGTHYYPGFEWFSAGKQNSFFL